jgi:hypothetical protein
MDEAGLARFGVILPSAAIPLQWLLLEPIRLLGEPVPPNGPRLDPWAPLGPGWVNGQARTTSHRNAASCE